ncbi:MAG TPA: BadF/BadG/BcrA/BcrD ATPase family protein [Candidatus Acidoferrum sp.]|nr:BadF/BadG/BcrA/BcrD ATPase family protein [Candidatus Acidoferrum sp.]
MASRRLVKKSLRLASVFFVTPLRRIDWGSPFFTYALSMDYVLGFDGGGTKTECVLMDPAGKILTRCFSGPSNPSRVGVESATEEIEKAADLCLHEAQVARNAVAAIGAGLAGTGKPEMRERMRASLVGAFSGAAVSIFTDLEIALAAAGEGPVIVLVAGTGSAAIGRNAQGQIWRTGGHGPRLGDDGSAFDIGSRAVARAMKERDQRGTDSILGMKILAQLGCASWTDLQERAALQPDKVFPSVFPIVAAAADAGDPAAREILLQAAGELSSLVNAVAEHSGYGRENIMIVKTGGTVGRCAFFDMQLDAALKRVLPQAQIGGLRMSPAEAAARAARY